MKAGGAAGKRETGEGAFAEPNLGDGLGRIRHEQRTQEGADVRIVADEQNVLAVTALVEETLEVMESGFGREGGGDLDRRFVAGFGANE